MERVKSALFAVVAGLLLFAGATGLLWWGATTLSATAVRVVAVLLVWAVLAGVPLGYYFGRVEARGFLRGADRAMDTILGRAIDGLERNRGQGAGRSGPAPQVTVIQPRDWPPELSEGGGGGSVFDYPRK